VRARDTNSALSANGVPGRLRSRRAKAEKRRGAFARVTFCVAEHCARLIARGAKLDLEMTG